MGKHEEIRSRVIADIHRVIMEYSTDVPHGRNAVLEALASHLCVMISTTEIRPERFERIDISKIAIAVLSAAISAVKEEAREQLGE